eukprot:gene10678-22286_t
MDFFKRMVLNHPYMKKLLKPLVMSQKSLQEEVDIYKAAILLTGNRLRGRIAKPLTDGDIESVYNSIDNLSENITKETRYSNHHDKIEMANLVAEIGFAVHSQPSKISNSGNGLFLKGKAMPGDVLALYPGMVHLSEYTSKAGYFQTLLPDDDLYLMSRMEGCVIDGRTAHQMPWNPYALAHTVNHPPQGSTPNVLQISYDFPGDPLEIDSFSQDLRYLIPNRYFKEPTMFGTPDRSALMRSLVLVALQPLADGDELLMDYRLNPAAPVESLPAWYTHVDKEQASRRWDIDINKEKEKEEKKERENTATSSNGESSDKSNHIKILVFTTTGNHYKPHNQLATNQTRSKGNLLYHSRRTPLFGNAMFCSPNCNCNCYYVMDWLVIVLVSKLSPVFSSLFGLVSRVPWRCLAHHNPTYNHRLPIHQTHLLPNKLRSKTIPPTRRTTERSAILPPFHDAHTMKSHKTPIS